MKQRHPTLFSILVLCVSLPVFIALAARLVAAEAQPNRPVFETGKYAPVQSSALYLPLVVGPCAGSTVVNMSGLITNNTTWTSNNVYHVTKTVVVNSGTTLTIEPGTVVKFDADQGLLVHGTLIADGSATCPIQFTSAVAVPKPGDWGFSYYNGGQYSILFEQGSQPAQTDNSGNYVSGSIVRNAIIEYSKGLGLWNGAFIDHNLIWHNDNHASGTVSVDGWGSTPILSNNRIVYNTGSVCVLCTSANQSIVRQNLIAQNQRGVSLMYGTQFISNTVTVNGGGSGLYGCDPVDGAICLRGVSSSLSLTGNNIYGNLPRYDLVMQRGTVGQTANATGNYWGTTDAAVIRDRIYDIEDDFNVGAVNSGSFLSQPAPQAPPNVYSP